ncbi:hypothetical protein V1512DRAFT_258383 [Lipomyces arxii]|uniref:uncharacterized protein n=1 Tax=Lipomyces arxii TaxID=56418 RepID=UPI0034CF593B
MRDNRTSLLSISARSNALHFYDPSPQRRHLQLETHYEHPTRQLQNESTQQAYNQRQPFYQLFADDSALLAEISQASSELLYSHTQSASVSTSTLSPATGASEAISKRVRPTTINYKSLLDPDVGSQSISPANFSSPAPSAQDSSDSSDSELESDREVIPVSTSVLLSTQSVLPPALPLTAYYQHQPPFVPSNISVRSSAASIRSFRSRTSGLSWNRKRKQRVPTLDTLPIEILDEVSKYLPQESLLAMVKTCKSIAASAYVYLYQSPKFTSTYRFAQFVSVISHDRTLASYVRSLDLSTIENGLRGNVVYASWRDWKYRNEPLYWTRKNKQSHDKKPRHRSVDDSATQLAGPVMMRTKSMLTGRRPSLSRGSSTSSVLSSSSSSSGYSTPPVAINQEKKQVQLSSHPLQSPLLKQYSLARDVPIGAVLHVVRACPHLQDIDLSYLPMAADYFVTSRKYKPTAFTSLLFVSDVPKSYTWRENETVQVHAARELVSALLDLRELRSLKLRNLVWINKDVIKRIVGHERVKTTLEFVDFRECGMTRGKAWALAGNVSDFEGKLEDED